MTRPHPEALLISSMLRQKDYVLPYEKGVSGKMFHIHREEWNWIEKYIGKHRKIPSRTAFTREFPDFKVYKADDIEHFAEQVKEEHVTHELTILLDQSVELLADGASNKALSKLQSRVMSLAIEVDGKTDEVEIISQWQDTYQEVSKRVASVAQTGLAGIPTGFPTLDLLTGGPVGGDLWVIASRLGQGKSWSLVRMACAAVFEGHTVQFDALEQSRSQIAMRAHSFMSSKYGREVYKSLDLMRGKNFNLRGYKEFLRNLKKKTDGRFFISDTTRGRVSPMTVAAQIERNRPRIVFIDYLTLMEQHGDDWRSVAKLSSDLKNVAQQYNVPIVAAAQINRAGEGKEPPKVNTLSQSDAIGMDSDAVVTLKQQSTHVMKFLLAKYRNGQDGQTWYCEFMPNSGKYEEISGDRAQELIEEDSAENG